MRLAERNGIDFSDKMQHIERDDQLFVKTKENDIKRHFLYILSADMLDLFTVCFVDHTWIYYYSGHTAAIGRHVGA